MVARLGPAGERLLRPLSGDRDGDGALDLLLRAEAGNSLVFGEPWQRDGRRATRLWRSRARPLETRLGPDEVVDFPIDTRFADDDGDAVSDIEEDAGVGACRACARTRVLTIRWRFFPRTGRYVRLGVEESP